MAQSDKADVFARESNISLLGWFRDASHSEGDLYPAHPDASGNGLAVADVKIDFIR